MSQLPMTFACGLYDRMTALYTGEVRTEGIDLNFIAVNDPRELFDRMVEYYRDNPNVTVMIDRRGGPDRRRVRGGEPDERRVLRDRRRARIAGTFRPIDAP